MKEDVGLRVTNQPLHCSTTIEEAFPWLDKLNEGKHRQDSQPEQDRSHHNIPSLFLLSFCGTSSTGQDELELRIANRPHLGQVEPFEFFFRAHSLAHEEMHQGVKGVRDREDHPHERGATDELGHELSRIAVEEPGDRAIHAVPASTVVAGPVSEEADREHTPEAARPVYRDRADRIVNLHHSLNELDTQADQESRDKPEDHRAD